jgi:hypothetical protein
MILNKYDLTYRETIEEEKRGRRMQQWRCTKSIVVTNPELIITCGHHNLQRVLLG